MVNKLHKVAKIHGEIQGSVSVQLSTLCREGRDSRTSQQGGRWLHGQLVVAGTCLLASSVLGELCVRWAPLPRGPHSGALVLGV